MSSIKLFSDSTCDLPISEIERMDVGIIPLIVTFEMDTYRDGVDITPKELFSIVGERIFLYYFKSICNYKKYYLNHFYYKSFN